jgi:hypothetical protein
LRQVEASALRLHPPDACPMAPGLSQQLDAVLGQRGDDPIECSLCHVAMSAFGRNGDRRGDLKPADGTLRHAGSFGQLASPLARSNPLVRGLKMSDLPLDTWIVIELAFVENRNAHLFGDNAGRSRSGTGQAQRDQNPLLAIPSLGRALGPTRVTAAPHVVASCGDSSKDGLRGDVRRHRVLHPELKLLAENPPLRARAPRQACAVPIQAHGKQFFCAALEEISSLGIVRCIGHRGLSDGSKNRQQRGSVL